MKPVLKFVVYILLTGVIIFASCKKEKPATSGIPHPPVANAGKDTTLLPGNAVTLDGSRSTDPDNNITSYAWTKISGPSLFDISNANTVKAQLTNLVEGTYQFELKVTDADGLFSKDSVQVTITPNHPPVANAGADQTIFLPTNTVGLDGRNSTDPENNIRSYYWTKISGPSAFYITNPTIARTAVTNLVEGTYKFELRVTDNVGAASEDTIIIIVIGNWNVEHWSEKQDMPYGGEPYLATINGKIYGGNSYDHTFYEYDSLANTWITKNNFPGLLQWQPVAFSVNNKIYVGLGSDYYYGGNFFYHEMWEYNPVNDQWTKKADIPGTISGDAVVFVINNKTYFVGGNNNHVLEYDPLADSYSQKNNFPGSEFDHMAAFVINGKGYCVGGGDNYYAQSSQCWEYDASNDSWTQKASLQSGTTWATGFSINNIGYVVGGLFSPHQIWHYDPLVNQWSAYPEIYPGLGSWDMKAVSLNGIVYIGLGFYSTVGDDYPVSDFWKFKP